MTERQRGRLWRTGQYLGLVTDTPKARVGSAPFWRNVLVLAVCTAVALAVASRL